MYKVFPIKIPGKSWNVVGANLLIVKKKNFFSVVNYHSFSQMSKNTISSESNYMLKYNFAV